MQTSSFSGFRLWSLYPTGIKVELKWLYHVLKHAEIQSETRGVQGFGAKFGASAAKTPAQQFRNQYESPVCILRTAIKLLSEMNISEAN